MEREIAARVGEAAPPPEMNATDAVAVGKPMSLVRLFLSCMVTGGVQYGWALQLSLLTPYVQTLGLSHTLSSFIWLGPIVGFILQPCIGLWSDRCRSIFGKRRPFIFVGCLLICAAVIVISFSSDIGYKLGDTNEDCNIYEGPRWRAAVVYVIGFWILDISNNIVQCPTRALMADLSGHHGYTTSNAICASWMAIGNILGYASGASGKWHNWFPFLSNRACCEACANLKGAFLVDVVFLLLCVTVTLIAGREAAAAPSTTTEEKVGIMEILKTIKNLPQGMTSIFLVTSLTLLSWFPFTLYDTDWMGREVFHGDPMGTRAQIKAYDNGVRTGALGLLINAVVVLMSSLLIEPVCRKLTPRLVWVMSNFFVFICMAAIVIISIWSLNSFHGSIHDDIISPDGRVKAVAIAVFVILGAPSAVLSSVPYAITTQLAANQGVGQGLCIGVLNISIVLPQVVVALGAGPWDGIFKKGNIPAFALASIFAFVCGIVGLFTLPKLSRKNSKASGMSNMQ